MRWEVKKKTPDGVFRTRCDTEEQAQKIYDRCDQDPGCTWAQIRDRATMMVTREFDRDHRITWERDI